MPGHHCYHCKQWVDDDEAHDCWTTTEAALDVELTRADMAFVNGFFYYCPRPVAAPEEAVGHPPREVWDELAASHPDIRARLATSPSVFERKLWREDLERWDREVGALPR